LGRAAVERSALGGDGGKHRREQVGAGRGGDPGGEGGCVEFVVGGQDKTAVQRLRLHRLRFPIAPRGQEDARQRSPRLRGRRRQATAPAIEPGHDQRQPDEQARGLIDGISGKRPCQGKDTGFESAGGVCRRDGGPQVDRRGGQRRRVGQAVTEGREVGRRGEAAEPEEVRDLVEGRCGEELADRNATVGEVVADDRAEARFDGHNVAQPPPIAHRSPTQDAAAGRSLASPASARTRSRSSSSERR
jgi:hypothetical protein